MKAELIISEELFKNMVSSLEAKLSNESTLKNEVKYHCNALNESLTKDFDQIVYVLQSLVDSYYLGYYDVSGFVCFNKCNFKEALSHNLSLIGNAKKLIKFIN